MAPLLDPPPSHSPSSHSPLSFTQPRPRPPRSPRHSAQIRAQNRRTAYLGMPPGAAYLRSAEHELADPLLYDRLVRRFQTPGEREAEGRAKGYARVLEGSLLRGEERMAILRAETTGRGRAGDGSGEGTSGNREVTASWESGGNGDGDGDGNGETARLNAQLVAPPRTREEGRAQWEGFLRDRFVRGEDGDFEYARVDGDDEYDVLEREEIEEAWFEAEDPGWVSEGEGESPEGGAAEKELHGETGVQDF